MQDETPTPVEILQLTSHPHTLLLCCSYDHAVALSERLADEVDPPMTLPAIAELRWCHHCAWCGVRCLAPATDTCLHHHPDPCPEWHRSETWVSGAALRHLALTYCDGESVPEDWCAQMLSYLNGDFDRWADVGGAELGDLVAVWAGQTPEDPF